MPHPYDERDITESTIPQKKFSKFGVRAQFRASAQSAAVIEKVL